MPRRDESIQIGHDVPPEVIASIEASSKMTIDDLKANPELVQFAVDRSKKSGNDANNSGGKKSDGGKNTRGDRKQD